MANSLPETGNHDEIYASFWNKLTTAEYGIRQSASPTQSLNKSPIYHLLRIEEGGNKIDSSGAQSPIHSHLYTAQRRLTNGGIRCGAHASKEQREKNLFTWKGENTGFGPVEMPKAQTPL